MSAETLREAAALMRSRAEFAAPSPWSQDDEYGMSVISGGVNILNGCCDGDGYVSHHDAEHIASWHPGVAEQVAIWLEKTAAGIERRGVTARITPAEIAALAVATAYLGEFA